MGKRFNAMLPEHEQFIKKQKLFFVASAPSEGHVNISPKGYDALRIFSPTEVAYLDLTGSGNETSAHLEENGRITFMFAAFEGSPLILRLYGTGRVIVPTMPEWNEWISHFELLPGARQIIKADIHAVSTSCGFGVPLFSFERERDTLLQSARKKGEETLHQYRKDKNSLSIDGLVTTLGKQYFAKTSSDSE
ncbi:pyridoxamine 5'-phosphate oxidase family protein [Paenibacillus thalictri]|uniref:Pyridoxamine 5'-phosphate oxidase family protein n=1 Tax=Paenibacillus thalictri TaxID=2527873 RepID=A0A4Q9DKZ4_9BACL|nr:pyridoxamine 5'-phosphate oxidase family protein [Paenibacillus thalictri]TBL75631.1 pyridoxamine 5'-phosphate oxidase family protein [Paenibacillus thalictri]